MKISFSKMTGAGNDFILIDDRKNKIKNPPSLARKICDRRWGIGADGLLLLRKSSKAAYEMKYYNSDGSYGGMCGNGGRCIALFAIRKGIAKKNHAFESIGYVYRAKIVNKSIISLQMKNPSDIRLNQKIMMDGKEITYQYINTGAPHVVIDAKEFDTMGVDDLNVQVLGRWFRYHDRFSPGGTNINFIERIEDNSIKIRTYERGVEAETLACGTGSIATAVISNLIWGFNPPIKIRPRSGVDLKISFKSIDKIITDVTLTGPAIITFEGIFDA